MGPINLTGVNIGVQKALSLIELSRCRRGFDIHGQHSGKPCLCVIMDVITLLLQCNYSVNNSDSLFQWTVDMIDRSCCLASATAACVGQRIGGQEDNIYGIHQITSSID